MRDITFTTKGPLGKSSLREANERVLLSIIRRQPGISRLDLARLTGLSPSAVTGIVDRLNEQGFLIEDRGPAGRAALGRPPIGLSIDDAARCAIGVEITPGEATLALADLSGRILEERQTPFTQPADAFLAAVHAGIRELAERAPAKLLGCAVSIPGNFDAATGRIRQATNLDWHDLDVHGPLKGDLPFSVLVENNANLSALAERWFAENGSAPLDDFLFVTLRVGIGTGLILDGRLIRGARQCAGEFGHMTIYPDGRKCLCGNTGCWEEYASDRALERLYQERGGPAVTSREVVERARGGEEAAQASLKEVARALGLGLATLIMGLNPAAIAVDDWAATGWDLIRTTVWEVLEQRVPEPWRQGVEIFPSRRATHASLAGAIALVLSQFFTSFESEHGAGPIEMALT